MATKCINCDHEIYQIEGHNHFDLCIYNQFNSPKLEDDHIRASVDDHISNLIEDNSPFVTQYKWKMHNFGYLNIVYVPKFIEHAINSYKDNKYDMDFSEFIQMMYG